MFKFLILFLSLFYISEGFEWKNWRSNLEGLPCDYPVEGGSYDTRTYYVIRANWGGGLLPGKYSPVENKGYVPFYNKEHAVFNFEV